MDKRPFSPSRRHFGMAAAGLAALAGLPGCAVAPARRGPTPTAVPHSTGEAVPRFVPPPLSCDAHHHIYDRRFPAHPSATLLPDDASIADYRLLQRRLGLERNVIVQPSTYGIDNRLLVQSLGTFGPASRGVAVVADSVTDAELRALHEAGVRGIRFNMSFLVAITPDMMLPLSRRIAPLGWHLQVNGTAEKLLPMAGLLESLACPVVFDHMGQLPQPAGIAHPAFAFYRRLLDQDKAWFKLSGAYISSKRADYADTGLVARELMRIAPERLVWGSDWPHPTKKAGEKPDDAAVLDKLDEWAPSAVVRDRILVDNPARLYRF